MAAPAHAADPVIAAAGDIACNPEAPEYKNGEGTPGSPGTCRQKATAQVIESLDPAHVLALGDEQYEDGKLSRFQESYAASWGRPSIKPKTRPVPGNHQYGAGNSASNPPGTIAVDPMAAGYFTYFNPELSQFGATATNPQKGWYSFDVPVGGSSWHVVAINSECAAGLRNSVGWEGGCAVGSEQEQWLRADLAQNTSDCTLAYWHHPRFSSGITHGDEPIMAPIWDALYDDYADIVLAGHDHHYERLGQADPAGARAPGRGIRSWVVGTGGKNQLGLQAQGRPATDKRANDTHGVLGLTLHGPAAGHPRGWYEWNFAREPASGPLQDSGSGDCVGPPGAPEAAGGATGGGASTGTGASGANSASQSVADRVAPVLSRSGLSRSRFRIGRGATARFAVTRRGTVITYTLSEAATVTLGIERLTLTRKGGKRVRRHRRVGSLIRQGRAGRRRVAFSGRIGSKALAKGSYRLTISAKDAAGNASRARRLTFTVVG